MNRERESTTKALSRYKELIAKHKEYEITENDISTICDLLGGSDVNAIDVGFRLGFVRGFMADKSETI